jgi:Holliday junction resolvasome RuvABC endonuclease subunit
VLRLPTPRRYIGIDVSLTDTGMAEVRKKKVTNWHNYGTPSTMADALRVDNIELEARTFIGGRAITLGCDNDAAVFIEDYAFSRTKGKMFLRAEVVGVLKGKLRLRDIPVFIVKPNILKQWTTGSGKAGKHDMCNAVYRRWGHHTTNDNVADAIALAMLGYHLLALGERIDVERLPPQNRN